MRNLFVKNYVAFALLILFSLSLSSMIFIAKINSFNAQEKQEQLSKTVEYVSDMISQNVDQMEQTTAEKSFLPTYLNQLVDSNGSTIMFTDLQGNILALAQPGSDVKISRDLGTISDQLTAYILEKGYFYGLGTISGLFSENYYIAGDQCTNENGEVIGLVIAGASATAMNNLVRTIMHTFVIIILFTLIATLIISYFLSGMMTKPLKNIGEAAKRFARGEFDVRVPEDNGCDEIDELAVSFNNMASSLTQLEELSRSFVSNVSHELKTPMTSIGGFVDGMLDGTIPKEQHEKYLAVISEEVKRLSRLVMRMLDAAKIQAGEMVINSMPFDLIEVVSNVIISSEKRITDKKLDVEVEMDDRLMVHGDRDYIFQVVYNLVDNAIKFVDEGGRLALRITTEGGMCQFSLTNTGATIPAEDLPHVFDRFYKADRSRSKDRTGAGLGLYIVKTIINLHGGDISVRSSGGETEFSFTLPLAGKQNSGSLVHNTPKEHKTERKS
ncbi:MAG: ATP-binding protein [Butyricicoccaceae bacterium]